MSTTPAAETARILRQHPLWTIRPVTSGIGWTARRDGYGRIWAVSLPDLELRIHKAEKSTQ